MEFLLKAVWNKYALNVKPGTEKSYCGEQWVGEPDRRILNRNAADKATVYAFQLNTCKGETTNNRLHYLNLTDVLIYEPTTFQQESVNNKTGSYY